MPGKHTSLKKNIIELMTAITFAATAVPFGRMRPLNILRDLPAVADLIELCFSSTLDPDGRSYIDQMRRNGRDSSFLSWAPRVIETVSLPLSGFVWENNGRVVANVSLIPFSSQGQKIFLIANVATHPDFRRQGIARQLTSAAMDRARAKHAQAIWLHVRDDNPGAIQLYNELGFVERSRRTTWQVSSGITSNDQPTSKLQITQPGRRDWPIQSGWLARAYPAELDWYHPQNWNIFRPGLFSAIYRILIDVSVQQWSAHRDGKPLGVLSCQRSLGRADHLWAALPARQDAEVVGALLRYGQQFVWQSRSLTFEYPVGPMDDAIRAAGFVPQRTLAWMKAPGAATF